MSITTYKIPDHPICECGSRKCEKPLPISWKDWRGLANGLFGCVVVLPECAGEAEIVERGDGWAAVRMSQ